MATRKRHTPQQVVRKLTQADRMLAESKEISRDAPIDVKC
jgi:hypothetical protein